MKVYSAEYRQCLKCEAELTEPLPPGWTWTVRGKVYPKITPHHEDCPDGFKKVALPDDL